MYKLLLTSLLLAFSSFLYAQTWEIGASIGGAGYMGDLNQHNPVKVSGVSLGGFVKRNFNGYFSVKGVLSYGRIAAADSTSNIAELRQRNLSFTNRIIEGSVMGEFNFMHYIPEAGKNRFTPFVFLGIGIAAHAPRTLYGNNEYGLRQLRTEDQVKPYSEHFMSIPYGVGIKYNIAGKWSLIADAGYRFTNTDYLDDVSGLYPNKNNLSVIGAVLSDRSGEVPGAPYIGTAGTQRGDLRMRDTYFFFNLSVSFTFVTEKCYYER